MRIFRFLSIVTLTILLLSHNNGFAFSNLMLINRIEGRVYDENRNPVEDANVELMDDVGGLLSHTKTTSGGRFTFFGVSSGRFKVKVLALRSNLITQTQDVEIVNLRANGSDTAYIDFYLRYNKAKSETFLGTPDSIFVQEIPAKARESYEKGVELLLTDKDKALGKFQESIQIFPEYFDALSALGRTYVNHKEYQKGYPFLLKAIDLNPRSSACFYSLGYAFLQLNQIPAAIEAAKATVFINASSVDSQLLYGTILRIAGSYDESEKTLVKAKSLAKKPDPEIYWQLALLYNKLKRNDDAANELVLYLKHQTDSSEKKKVEELISKLRKKTQ